MGILGGFHNWEGSIYQRLMAHGPYFLCSSSWAAVFWLSRSTWFRISSSSWGVRGASELSCCCLRCRCCQTLTLGGGGSKTEHPSNYNQIHSFILQHQIPQPMTFGIKYHNLWHLASNTTTYDLWHQIPWPTFDLWGWISGYTFLLLKPLLGDIFHFKFFPLLFLTTN